MAMTLLKHQQEAIEATEDKNRVAFYWDMGLGKTFGGSEKMIQLGAKVNLVICQKSKIDDWIEHFKTFYGDKYNVYDLTIKKHYEKLCYQGALQNAINDCVPFPYIFIINYELAFRRKELLNLEHFTLMLDESSLIQNEKAKQSKFILRMKPDNVILLSGTPIGGKYEKLWSQMKLLGWNISKKMFYNQFVDYHYEDNEGFPRMIIDGYKNEERLKRKMRAHGCHFLKTDEVFDLPEQIHQTIKIPTSKEYRRFRKDCIVQFKSNLIYSGEESGGVENYHNLIELVGDTTLTKMLYERQLCGQYNEDKLQGFRDLVESTNDRLIAFYNFTAELNEMWNMAHDLERPCSQVNGDVKDLTAYERYNNSITFIQYQAGSMGLNLQKANKILYFTPPLSSELFEQSKKRIHRINQTKPCFYYYLTVKNSVEEKIYKTLKMRKDYTNALFEQEE